MQMKENSKIFAKAAGMLCAMTLLCGVLYGGVVTGAAQLFFPGQANGSIIEVDGKEYGCELLAQEYTEKSHMWGRVMYVTSVTDGKGERKMYAGPSNFGPESRELKAAVEERIARIKEADPDAADRKIPVDLVTCSGSGLDPDISLAAALYQAPRLAKENDMSEEEIEKIIEECRTEKFLGIFGEDTVNVLKVNLMLEGIL